MISRPTNVIWITGLSAAGKTTLATAVAQRLRDEGEPVVLLDGDDLREALAPMAAHGQATRLTLAFQYARLARLLARQGISVVVGTIGLFREIHAWNRAHQPGYFEVYLRVPLDELRRRDPKGIYRRFDAGELRDVAGLDLPVDEPTAPHMVLTHAPGLGPEAVLSLFFAKFAAHRHAVL